MRSSSLNTEAAGAAPPDAFGPFRVLHQIGAGTLGPVFRAYDPQQDRLVAVKLFRLNLTPELVHTAVAGFERLLAADLAHPAIATPVAAGMVDVAPYLAQDFVAAESLDTVIREWRGRAATDAVRVATHLAGALDFAAAVGVLHGALHPRDVLVAGDDARLTGLGVAQVLETVHVTPPVRRPYAAPERVAGQPWDRRADVYSLAVLVAEMMTGRRPSSAAVLETLFEGWDGDRAAICQVLARAMADRTDQRFDTALAFADALKHVSERAGAPAQATATPLLADVEPVLIALPARAADDPPDLAMARLPLDEPMLGPAPALLPGDELPLEDAGTAVPTLPGDWSLRSADPPAVLPDAAPLAIPAAPVSPGLNDTPELPGLSLSAPAATAATGTSSPPRFAPPPSSSSSSIWPIPLALMVGLIVGIAVGFFIFGSQPAQGDAEMAVSTVATPVAAATPGVPATAAAPTTSTTSTPGAVATPAAGTAPAPAAPAPPSGIAATATAVPAPAAPAPVAAPVTSSSSRPPSRDTRDGRIVVRTTPAGARVLIDGKDAGVTPLTVRALPYGSHTLRLSREGYISEERRVTISSGQPAPSLVVGLSRERRPPPASQAGTTAPAPLPARNGRGTLVVESRPTGAAVFVDGTRVGATPLTLDTVASGSHAISLELDGYRRWTSSVRVAAGERNRVTASLEQ